MPELSNWKMPVVRPDDRSSYAFDIVQGQFSISSGVMFTRLSFVDHPDRVMNHRQVLRPRKSNFTRPIFSTSVIEYWVTISSLAPL